MLVCGLREVDKIVKIKQSVKTVYNINKREVKMKTFFKSTAGIVLTIVLIVGIVFGGGFLGLKYKQTFCVANKDVDRQIFKQSATYNEGKLDDLAKYKLEMAKAEDDVERAAIAELVNSVYANYDESKIENNDLKDFLDDCRDGKYIIMEED
jgi:hypothetical protein